jgi:uncharacterized protein YlxW (UPF0749 family)
MQVRLMSQVYKLSSSKSMRYSVGQVERGMRRIEQLEAQLRECKSQLSRVAEEREDLSKTCDQLRTQQLTRDAENIRLRTLIIGNCEYKLVHS